PTFGATVVATVLNTPELRAMWEDELGAIRMRIRALREQLVAGLKAEGVTMDLDFVLRQKGMFSYSGLNAAQMNRLKTEFGIYGLDTGRICVAALNSRNLPVVSRAMATVLRG
ncbi:MAG: aminotransferase class I/II-fold pyridoxal phosphate-dependent enzyme, partial [Rubrivivax sp.]